MEEKKSSKLQDIKETASDAVEIMRQIGTPGVLESLTKVKETAKTVNEIMRGLNSPEMVKNIENFRLISENMNEASSRMEKTVIQMRETGLLNEASGVIKSAKQKINSFDLQSENPINGFNLVEITGISKEMLQSIKNLVNEINLTLVSARNSVAIEDANQDVEETSKMYRAMAWKYP